MTDLELPGAMFRGYVLGFVPKFKVRTDQPRAVTAKGFHSHPHQNEHPKQEPLIGSARGSCTSTVAM